MEILRHPSCLLALSATRHLTSQLCITSPSTRLVGSVVAPKVTDAHSHPLHATPWSHHVLLWPSPALHHASLIAPANLLFMQQVPGRRMAHFQLRSPCQPHPALGKALSYLHRVPGLGAAHQHGSFVGSPPLLRVGHVSSPRRALAADGVSQEPGGRRSTEVLLLPGFPLSIPFQLPPASPCA